MEGKCDKVFDNATHYLMKTTDKQLYVYRNILEYVDGEYIITNKISDKNIKEMRLNMTDADAEEFDEFVARHWEKKAYIEWKRKEKKNQKLQQVQQPKGEENLK